MGFRRSDLQEAFFVPGDRAFRVWGYSTSDALEEVLRPGCFAASGLLGLGELIYLRLQALPPRGVRRAEPEPVRMALLMVVGASARGAAAVRLAQDFGSTEAPAALAEPPPLAAPADPATAAPGRQPQQEAGGDQRPRRRAGGALTVQRAAPRVRGVGCTAEAQRTPR